MIEPVWLGEPVLLIHCLAAAIVGLTGFNRFSPSSVCVCVCMCVCWGVVFMCIGERVCVFVCGEGEVCVGLCSYIFICVYMGVERVSE